MPGPVCLPVKFSSANLAPYILRQPVPSPCRVSKECGGCQAVLARMFGKHSETSHLDKVSTLDHKSLNDPMETTALVADGLHVAPAVNSSIKYFCVYAQHACDTCMSRKMRDSVSHLYSPVKSCLTFSAVLGTTSANSSIVTRPAGVPPIVTSAAL